MTSGDFMKKKTIFVCSSGILLILILIHVIWLNYAPIINYPFEDLQYITIRYFDANHSEYREIIIEDDEEIKLIYNMLKSAKLVNVDRGPRDECGSDSGWYLMLYFKDAMECYDSGVNSIEYGCRKYIRSKKNNSVEGILFISSEEIFTMVEKYLSE